MKTRRNRGLAKAGLVSKHVTMTTYLAAMNQKNTERNVIIPPPTKIIWRTGGFNNVLRKVASKPEVTDTSPMINIWSFSYRRGP